MNLNEQEGLSKDDESRDKEIQFGSLHIPNRKSLIIFEETELPDKIAPRSKSHLEERSKDSQSSARSRRHSI